MKRKLSSRRCFLPAGLVLLAGFWLLSAPALASQIAEQNFTFKKGWNAIYFEVQPEPSDPASVLDGLPVESVWVRWDRSEERDYLEDPADGLENAPGWRRIYLNPPRPPFLSDLYSMRANEAYLVKLSEEPPPGWPPLTGRPSHRTKRWATNAWNLVGFSLDESSPPTFGAYFQSSRAHAGQPIYRLGQDGRWAEVTSPGSTNMASGEAFWIYCKGGSTFPGPLDVELSVGDGLDFGAGIQEHSIRLRNLDPSPTTATLELVAQADPQVPLLYAELNSISGKTEWFDFSTMPAVTVAAGATVQVRLGPRRETLSADTHESVLSIQDSKGGRMLLPVHVRKP